MTSPSPAPLARVYVAAPCGEAHVANMLHALLDRAGFRVVSQWTDRLRTQSARPSREEMAAIHRANCAELDDADLVVAWTAAGTPRATYSEIGAALAKGKPVLWLQGPNGEGSNSYDTEPLVRVLVVDLGETRMERDAAIVRWVREMVEEQHARAERLEALARVATPGAPRWGEPADSGAPTCRAHGCHAPPGEPCREKCIHLADKGSDRDAPAPAEEHPWNTCEACGQPVDIAGESFDGTEVLCHGCNTWNVVVALECGGWMLEARKPCGCDEEDDRDCTGPKGAPIGAFCACPCHASALDKGAA